MTLESSRALAALHTIPGFHLLLNEVVNLKREATLDKLKTAREQQDIVIAAMEFRIWDEVYKSLRATVADAVRELKEQGDEIYG